MSSVVCFEHRGFRCALPACQVLGAQSGQASRSIELWAGKGDSPSGERGLLVETPAGPRWLSCDGSSLGDVSGHALWAVPDLLQQLMCLPHVVGAFGDQGRLVWLVDLEHWAPGDLMGGTDGSDTTAAD